MFRTEHEFTLPLGFLDGEGTLHREGVMRLATAADEIAPLRDDRVQANPAYLTIILLSRVVTSLGDVRQVTPATIEGLFAADLDYLQDLYNEINQFAPAAVSAVCPSCRQAFEVERPFQEPSGATPSNGSTRR